MQFKPVVQGSTVVCAKDWTIFPQNTYTETLTQLWWYLEKGSLGDT